METAYYQAVEAEKDDSRSYVDFKEIALDGSVATVAAQFRVDNGSMPLTFILRHNSAGYWRLVEITEADRFIFGPPG